jgi:hypothetical protein
MDDRLIYEILFVVADCLSNQSYDKIIEHYQDWCRACGIEVDDVEPLEPEEALRSAVYHLGVAMVAYSKLALANALTAIKRATEVTHGH